MARWEMRQCSYAPWSQGYGLWRADFSLEPGELVLVESDTNEDAHLFMRSMASLEKPLSGQFFYRDSPLDFSDYRRLLAYKRKVGYITCDSAVFTNRSLGESLLFERRYFEDNPFVGLDAQTEELARFFEIYDRLYQNPAQAYQEDIRLTIIVRELAKKPELLLVERTSESLDKPSEKQFVQTIEKLAAQGQTMILYTFNKSLAQSLAAKKVVIRQGSIKTQDRP